MKYCAIFAAVVRWLFLWPLFLISWLIVPVLEYIRTGARCVALNWSRCNGYIYKPLRTRPGSLPGTAQNQIYFIMNIREILPALALSAGLVAVVVVSSFVLGGYGLILSGSVVAVILSGSPSQDSQPGGRG